jgi:spoIIIJ-associated protein
MIKEIVASGKTITEAQENARAALGAGPLDDVRFEIVHAGSKGIFGIIGVKPAQVKAYIELPDSGEERLQKQKARRERPERKNSENRDESQQKPRHNQKQNKQKKQSDKKPAVPDVSLNMERIEAEDGIDCSFDFVKSVLSDIGLSAEAELYRVEDGTRRIVIVGEDASMLIGHHGDTLDSLQYLANLASARKNVNGERDKSRVTIDIEGYRAKREETLRALARRMAAKALRNKRSVMLEPMSAYERRIIHSEVQSIEGVSTNSVGADTNRKIVIYLTDKKPEGIFEETADVSEIPSEADTFDKNESPSFETEDSVAISEEASDSEEI